jgi:hypothetical protein
VYHGLDADFNALGLAFLDSDRKVAVFACITWVERGGLNRTTNIGYRGYWFLAHGIGGPDRVFGLAWPGGFLVTLVTFLGYHRPTGSISWITLE